MNPNDIHAVKELPKSCPNGDHDHYCDMPEAREGLMASAVAGCYDCGYTAYVPTANKCRVCSGPSVDEDGICSQLCDEALTTEWLQSQQLH